MSHHYTITVDDVEHELTFDYEDGFYDLVSLEPGSEELEMDDSWVDYIESGVEHERDWDHEFEMRGDR